MKHMLALMLFTTSLFSFYLADILPKETVQIVDSFDCFSKDDKTVLYTYVLALKYRMDHVDDRDALVKSDLDYWRLWHLTSDIERACALNYKFDDILEETITPADEDKKVLKKLRRVEGGIRTDGSSESSAKMDKYDDKLRKKLLSNPPKFKVAAKNPLLQDYDLSTLKHYRPNSIPKTVYDGINKKGHNGVKKELLFRYALLKEEMIRKYDKPEERQKIKQEMLYLEQCQKYHDTYLEGEFYQNFKRNLANRSVTYNSYHPLKHEFLPKEIEAYCEYNISKTDVTPFAVKKDKHTEKKKRVIAFEKSKRYIADYKGDVEIKKKMNTYLDLLTRQMDFKEKELVSGLRLLRLSSCFKGDDMAFIQSVFEDIKENDLKEEFMQKVLQSQVWWAMTIKMKMDQEGESEELKHFFDCNQTTVSLVEPPKTEVNTLPPTVQSPFSRSDLSKAITQKDSILKYYANIFENRPTPDLDNKKAIDAGIVSKNWINSKGEIVTPLGESVEIKGMPEGGIKVTYTGIPKGELCTDFIQLNKNDVIFFNSKTYDGIDYIMLNGAKIKINHYVYKHVQRLCSKEDNNTISFIKERPIAQHNYSGYRSAESCFGNVQKIKSMENNRHAPNSFAHAKGGNALVASGSKAKLYDIRRQTLIKELPREFENSYHLALSADESRLVTSIGYKIHVWDMLKSKLIKTIADLPKETSTVLMVLPDNKTLVVGGEKLQFLDSETGKTVGEIDPKFMSSKKKYGGPQITAITISPDGGTLYIGSNKGKIERWNMKKGWLKPREIRYIDEFEDKESGGIGALVFDPRDENILISGSRNTKIRFWNVEQKKIVQTLIADEYMGCNDITFSDDNKYMLASGEHGVFLWRLGNDEQLDVINGDKIVGGAFLPNSSKFVTVDRTISIWDIKK